MFCIRDEDLVLVKKAMKKGDSAREINRAHVLYHRHLDWSVIEVAESLDTTPRTVINICNTYQEHGLERALHDDPRPGRPPKFDDRIRTKVVAYVCSDPPEGFDRWTLDLLKEKVEKAGVVDSISRDTISVILQEHDLKPWQQKMWCVPELNDEFIERMEDVLDVYELPYDPTIPVVCIDEKPVVLLDDKRAPVAMSEGKAKRVDYEYIRNGSVNTFCAVEPKSGFYINRVTDNRCNLEFAQFMASIEERYHGAQKIIAIMDNLSTHTEKALIDYFGEETGKKLWSRFDVHFTPKHASWLNQAEIAVGMYGRQCLGSTRIPDIKTLRRKTAAWNRCVNERKVVIKWKFSKEDAREIFDYS